MNDIYITINPLVCAIFFVGAFIIWRFQIIPRAIEQFRKGGRL